MSADLGREYARRIGALQERILTEEEGTVAAAARRVADQVRADRLVHVYGPGGHSQLAAQEVFFRAGGLMHISAILEEGTMLSGGALRSMAVERLPGYGRIVVEDHGLGEGDLLVLVNAYGINSALIDAARRALELGADVIGVSSREHGDGTAADHPARHPSGLSLHEVVPLHVDCKVPIGDAVMTIPGAAERTGAISTFANAFVMNWIMMSAVALLTAEGHEVPLWRSGNAPGGDEANARSLARVRGRVRSL